MVTDQEPRYRFRDSNGNITGTVFERGGELVMQEGTSGNENELVLQSDGIVQAKRLAGGYLYAGAFDGADADARLSNALAASNEGDTIYLENVSYSATTVSTDVSLIGTGDRVDGTEFSGDLTLSGSTSAFNLRMNGNTITHDGGFATLDRIFQATIQINDSGVTVHNGLQIDATVASGVSRTILDNLTDGSLVTDNGSATIIGDVR